MGLSSDYKNVLEQLNNKMHENHYQSTISKSESVIVNKNNIFR